jgi:hypothetical protein
MPGKGRKRRRPATSGFHLLLAFIRTGRRIVMRMPGVGLAEAKR